MSDLTAEFNFIEAQLAEVLHDGPARYLAPFQQRVARVHRRLDEIEQALRVRAADFGLDQHIPLVELRRQLSEFAQANVRYSGPERRRNGQRQDGPSP